MASVNSKTNVDVQGAPNGAEWDEFKIVAKTGLKFLSEFQHNIDVKKADELLGKRLFGDFDEGEDRPKFSVPNWNEDTDNNDIEEFLRLFPRFVIFSRYLRIGVTRRSYIQLLQRVEEVYYSESPGYITLEGAPASGKSSFSWWLITLLLYVRRLEKLSGPEKGKAPVPNGDKKSDFSEQTAEPPNKVAKLSPTTSLLAVPSSSEKQAAAEELQKFKTIFTNLGIGLPTALLFKVYGKEYYRLIYDEDNIFTNEDNIFTTEDCLDEDCYKTNRDLFVSLKKENYWSFSERTEIPIWGKRRFRIRSVDCQENKEIPTPKFTMPSFTREELSRIVAWATILEKDEIEKLNDAQILNVIDNRLYYYGANVRNFCAPPSNFRVNMTALLAKGNWEELAHSDKFVLNFRGTPVSKQNYKAEGPTGEPADDSADDLAGKPADDFAGKPADDLPGKPADDLPGKPADDLAGKPEDDLAGKPADERADIYAEGINEARAAGCVEDCVEFYAKGYSAGYVKAQRDGQGSGQTSRCIDNEEDNNKEDSAEEDRGKIANLFVSFYLFKKWHSVCSSHSLTEYLAEIRRSSAIGGSVWGNCYETTIGRILKECDFRLVVRNYNQTEKFIISRASTKSGLLEFTFCKNDMVEGLVGPSGLKLPLKANEAFLLKPDSPTNPGWDFIMYIQTEWATTGCEGVTNKKWTLLLLQCTVRKRHVPITCEISAKLRDELKISDSQVILVFVSPHGSTKTDRIHENKHFHCKVDHKNCENLINRQTRKADFFRNEYLLPAPSEK